MTAIDWNNPPCLSTAVCRPALPKDTADVIDLTRTIWNGHDYIPYVWKDWMADPHGLLAVAELEGRVVGIGKLTRLSDDGWWLEGLRVHPEFEGRRIASYIMEYLYDIWERKANGVVRLATASYRLSVQHLCDRMAFRKIGEFSEFSAPAIENGNTPEQIGFTHLQAGQEDKAVSYISQSPVLSLSYGFIDLGYRWVPPAVSHIAEPIREGHAWWWRGGSGFLVMMDWEEDNGEKTQKISMLACSLEDLPAMLEDARRLVGALGFARLGWVAPLHPDLLPILSKCHFV